MEYSWLKESTSVQSNRGWHTKTLQNQSDSVYTELVCTTVIMHNWKRVTLVVCIYCTLVNVSRSDAARLDSVSVPSLCNHCASIQLYWTRLVSTYSVRVPSLCDPDAIQLDCTRFLSTYSVSVPSLCDPDANQLDFTRFLSTYSVSVPSLCDPDAIQLDLTRFLSTYSVSVPSLCDPDATQLDFTRFLSTYSVSVPSLCDPDATQLDLTRFLSTYSVSVPSLCDPDATQLDCTRFTYHTRTLTTHTWSNSNSLDSVTMTAAQTWAIQLCSKRGKGKHGDWTKYTSLGRFPSRRLVCFALSARGTSHVPTHGQIPGLFYWDSRSDGWRRNSMTFTRNLRAIIFESRPVFPLFTTLIIRRQLMKFHLPLIVIYKAGLSISGTNPHTLSLIQTPLKLSNIAKGEGGFSTNTIQKVNFFYIPLK
jgi:hypothetical protein